MVMLKFSKYALRLFFDKFDIRSLALIVSFLLLLIFQVMASTSNSPPSPAEQLDLGTLSAYEDALDESESELRRLCEVAAEHLTRERPRPQAIILPPLLRSASSTTKNKRSSSSDHSSIEKVTEDSSGQLGIRSRRSANTRVERTKRNGQKSSSEHSESPDDWRAVNYTFQEITHYPVLIQINQQMQMLSRQLYDIESTNSLQLKIIAQLLNKLIKARQRPFFTFTRLLKFIPIILFIIVWPIFARSLYTFIARRRRGMAMNILRYL
ncbi:unnamed protein product [Cylicocyclus nassatus]|uniref:Uncharacterized protein n=1 Tax=Cylicocyclus nassatus TaxID=53992 RepID=A0AA36M511_CYLNA|nr:unnamed protein product [Cylicocyclus nassatus]